MLRQCKAVCAVEFCSFSLAPLQNCSQVDPVVYTRCNRPIFFFLFPSATHEKRAAVIATMEHMKICAQQRWVKESAAE